MAARAIIVTDVRMKGEERVVVATTMMMTKGIAKNTHRQLTETPNSFLARCNLGALDRLGLSDERVEISSRSHVGLSLWLASA